TGLQQLPLTYRGTRESFWEITGSTADGRVSHDSQSAVHTSATWAELMGYAKLPQIVGCYNQQGKGQLRIALIQNGSLPNERIALGRIDNILEEAERNLVGVPAIIVLGEVVAKHRAFEHIKKELQSLTV